MIFRSGRTVGRLQGFREYYNEAQIYKFALTRQRMPAILVVKLALVAERAIDCLVGVLEDATHLSVVARTFNNGAWVGE